MGRSWRPADAERRCPLEYWLGGYPEVLSVAETLRIRGGVDSGDRMASATLAFNANAKKREGHPRGDDSDQPRGRQHRHGRLPGPVRAGPGGQPLMPGATDPTVADPWRGGWSHRGRSILAGAVVRGTEDARDGDRDCRRRAHGTQAQLGACAVEVSRQRNFQRDRKVALAPPNSSLALAVPSPCRTRASSRRPKSDRLLVGLLSLGCSPLQPLDGD